jgi:hypothetical protein
MWTQCSARRRGPRGSAVRYPGVRPLECVPSMRTRSSATLAAPRSGQVGNAGHRARLHVVEVVAMHHPVPRVWASNSPPVAAWRNDHGVLARAAAAGMLHGQGVACRCMGWNIIEWFSNTSPVRSAARSGRGRSGSRCPPVDRPAEPAHAAAQQQPVDAIRRLRPSATSGSARSSAGSSGRPPSSAGRARMGGGCHGRRAAARVRGRVCLRPPQPAGTPLLEVDEQVVALAHTHHRRVHGHRAKRVAVAVVTWRRWPPRAIRRRCRRRR